MRHSKNVIRSAVLLACCQAVRSNIEKRRTALRTQSSL